MKRLLIIPAAGRGTRLGAATPKALCPVNGRPMIDYLVRLYRGTVDRFIIVVSPDSEQAVRDHCDRYELGIEYGIQAEPTGMLDAILVPVHRVRQLHPEQIWITWCDQIAMEPETIARLRRHAEAFSGDAVVLPTMVQSEPYIHFVRDERSAIVAVKQRREGDEMPLSGESDMGLFSLTYSVYSDLLPRFRDEVYPGAATAERNFLPFIPWVNRQVPVQTFPGCHELESVGINTPDELTRIENHLSSSGVDRCRGDEPTEVSEA